MNFHFFKVISGVLVWYNFLIISRALMLGISQTVVVLLQIWEVVYGKDNQVKEVPKVMQLKGHKVSQSQTWHLCIRDHFRSQNCVHCRYSTP